MFLTVFSFISYLVSFSEMILLKVGHLILNLLWHFVLQQLSQSLYDPEYSFYVLIL